MCVESSASGGFLPSLTIRSTLLPLLSTSTDAHLPAYVTTTLACSSRYVLPFFLSLFSPLYSRAKSLRRRHCCSADAQTDGRAVDCHSSRSLLSGRADSTPRDEPRKTHAHMSLDPRLLALLSAPAALRERSTAAAAAAAAAVRCALATTRSASLSLLLFISRRSCLAAGASALASRVQRLSASRGFPCCFLLYSLA